MEVWDKKDPKYIKGYRIVQLENGEEQIVVTYGDGATYNVDYSKEMAEKLTYKMETQFTTARSKGEVTKTMSEYMASKFMSGLGVSVGIISTVAYNLPDSIRENIFDGNDNILLSIMTGGFVSGIALYAIAKSKQKRVNEAELIAERNRNRALLDTIDEDSPVIMEYPFISENQEEGLDPFSIPNMENNGVGLADMRKIIKVQGQVQYLNDLATTSLDDLKKANKQHQKRR